MDANWLILFLNKEVSVSGIKETKFPYCCFVGLLKGFICSKCHIIPGKPYKLASWWHVLASMDAKWLTH